MNRLYGLRLPKNGLFIVLIGIVGLGIGWYLGSDSDSGHEHAADPSAVASGAEVWTCSMHPQIRLPEPGQCPICAMDLIPVQDAGEAAGTDGGQLVLSEKARRLASIAVAPVQRQAVRVETRMVGKIAYDETRLKYITAWVPGRIERLFVDYTGIAVQAGDHMVSLYSPELLTAQQELIEALKATKGQGSGALGQASRSMLVAARQKLALWGLTKKQIEAIERQEEPSDRLTVYAPVGGTVVERHVTQGAYVQTGTRIYTIADLSQVWLQLDAYESDLSWLYMGQEVDFETEAMVGERFSGTVAFIEPVLREQTRTVRVRVNVPNAAGRLKPGMFVRARAYAEVSGSGRATARSLAGKWISPMHPEIVQEGPGACPVCGMDLVPAESLGLVDTTDAGGTLPLVVPATAVLQTGRRAVVYVAVEGQDGVFEGRQIVLGQRTGDYYVVREGLQAGEQVVVNGAFKIDSDLQIRGRPSMMAPAGGQAPVHRHGESAPKQIPVDAHGHGASEAAPMPQGPVPAALPPRLDDVLDAYLDLQQALSQDRMAAAEKAAVALAALASGLDDGALVKAVQGLVVADDMAQLRKAFAPLSASVIDWVRTYGPGRHAVLNRFVCPMAMGNQGAAWLQKATQTQNPYYGAAMFGCGTLEERLEVGVRSAQGAGGQP